MLHSPDRRFSAWITIEGVETQEYSVETSEDGKTVTCWIASELGKKFVVHWTNLEYDDAIKGVIKMDGNDCGATVTLAPSAKRVLPRTVRKEGVDQSAMNFKPFQFSSLASTDDDSLLTGPSVYEHLGVINLEIIPVLVTAENTAPGGLNQSLSKLTVHERSKKAVTQQITLANSEHRAKPMSFSTSKIAGPAFVRFQFKYRPIDVLRANGIAPALKRKTPPPREPTPEEDDPDEEEARVLRERLKKLDEKRALKNKKPQVKREGVKSEEDVIDLTQSNKRVKLEEKKPRPFVSGEVIDLT
ncbi:hypothetical protein FB45DRAFT_891321 [Roridomyces roridus]|uniref:DUF7918 domain-containing protein n=1 Tax=Roridomyces roridus TaxID=1738132 RepID=A0AAD7CG03_9AGAR|nr:hypothetical protein FB45DRAFT_891321 [Roridomyces roridus]